MKIRHLVSRFIFPFTDFLKKSFCILEEKYFRIFNFFENQECISCGLPCGFDRLCSKCRAELEDFVPYKDKSRCSICGRILLSEKENCMECRSTNLLGNFSSVFPLFTYRLWKKDLVFFWKTDEQRNLSPLFARLLYKALKSSGLEGLQIVPVPPRPGKIRKKGWDQVEDLAFYLEYRYGQKVVKPLRRTSSKEQKKMDRKERLSGEKPDYVWNEKFKGNLEEEIVLLDDIITTGATFEKCRKVLFSKGVKKIHGISLFRV